MTSELTSAPLSRRGLFVLAAAGLGTAIAAAPGRAFGVTTSPSPTLPGEYYRKANQVTPAGTLYDNIVVRINGDSARLHVPQTVKPGAAVGVTWFYHGAGSDHNALDGGFKTSAASVVDRGGIAICQTAGGTLYSHPTAVALQVAGYSWISGIYAVTGSTLRATSGGGALACETYAAKLIPNIVGLYNVNAVYDIYSLWASGGEFQASVVAAFGNDPAAVAAANPARHGASAWAGAKIRVVVSQPNSSDITVPPEKHGLALLSLASPVAAEASLRAHTNGHATPSFSVTDFQTASARWLSPSADTTAPGVTITGPASGAAATGTIALTAAAGDAVNVATVTFQAGGVSIPARMNLDAITVAGQPLATAWIADFDTRLVPNGTVSVVAVAKDPSGNTTTSTPIDLAVSNADTTAPTVSILSPVNGATVGGIVTAQISATDAVGVVKVGLYAGTRLVGWAVSQGGSLWTLTFNTKTAATPNGTYILTAKATDAAGNTGTSAPSTVTIKN